MTALTFMIDALWKFKAAHPNDSDDNIIDRIQSECEHVGIDMKKVGRAAFAGDLDE